MNASSQTPPGALPPELSPVLPPMADAVRAAYAAYGVALPAPAGPAVPTTPVQACADCGSTRSPLVQRDTTSAGQPVWGCLGGCTPAPTFRMYDAPTVEAMTVAAREQARAEHAAELAQAAQDREAREWFHARQRAVGQLCETHAPDGTIPVQDVWTALAGPAPARLALTLTWDGTLKPPAGDGPGETTLVGATTAHGGRAVLVLDDEQRLKLASLLDAEVRDVAAPCFASQACGTVDDLDASDPMLFGWSRLEVAGIEGGPRWYCTPHCVSNAFARAGDDLAVIDDMAAVDGGL